MAIDPETQRKLIEAATEARKHSYAPYSNYKVGAALLTKSGKIYTGCNIENAAYTPTICAERTAIYKAVSEGARDFIAVAVVTSDGGAPCGVCRQVMREFAEEMIVIKADINGSYTSGSLSELLPDSFGPDNLSNQSS